MPTPDLTGRTFDRLWVLRRAPRRPETTHAEWACLCQCGTETVVTSSALRSGNTRSCGCLRREVTIARSTKHGGKPRNRATPTYNSWTNMLARCTNPDHPRWADWGGRGITVDPRWLDYREFLADMGERPPGTTLHRKDNNGPYNRDNCVWAGPDVQAANSRNVKLTATVIRQVKQLSARGLTMTAIGKQLGLNRHTVSKALFAG